MQHVDNYEQAVEYLLGRVNYERIAGSQFTADDFKLDRMRELLRRLGDPQEAIPAVHIAGTKGKGSTAALLASFLSAAGIRAGLFTSPHVSAFEERMAVDGIQPGQGEIVELVAAVAGAVAELDRSPGRMSPTFFEIATALAWLYFRDRRAEIAVLEVGMGGRLDATNICRPEVAVITSISRDHTRQLGSRLEQIAAEKGGIIKPGVPVVSGVTSEPARGVIGEICRSRGAPLFELGRDFDCEYHAPTIAAGAPGPEYAAVSVRTRGSQWNKLALPLVGEHQARNLALAIAALERLTEGGWKIPRECVSAGLALLRWPGRIEIVAHSPTVIIDAAHNWESVSALVKTLGESFPARRRVLVFAATRDKDVAGMLRQLLPAFETVILTTFQNSARQLPVGALVRLAADLTTQPLHAAADPAAAWKLARHLTAPEDLICITGSFFIAAEMRELIVDAAGRGETDQGARAETWPIPEVSRGLQ